MKIRNILIIVGVIILIVGIVLLVVYLVPTQELTIQSIIHETSQSAPSRDIGEIRHYV